MLKVLFVALWFGVANAEFTNLINATVKDLDNKDFSFKAFEGSCVLVVVLSPGASNTGNTSSKFGSSSTNSMQTAEKRKKFKRNVAIHFRIQTD